MSCHFSSVCQEEMLAIKTGITSTIHAHNAPYFWNNIKSTTKFAWKQERPFALTAALACVDCILITIDISKERTESKTDEYPKKEKTSKSRYYAKHERIQKQKKSDKSNVCVKNGQIRQIELLR